MIYIYSIRDIASILWIEKTYSVNNAVQTSSSMQKRK